MVIRRSDRVAEVLSREAGLIDVLVATSSVFLGLRNPLMRRTMGRLATIEQAARVAGIDPEWLTEHLNQALLGLADPVDAHQWSESLSTRNSGMNSTDSTVPSVLASIHPERVVDLDVREDLRSGREPFSRIMAARRDLPPGGVLRLRAIFEPVPLYAVMAKQGFDHWTEELSADDWRVWFYPADLQGEAPPTQPPASPKSGAPELPGEGSDDVIVLDVRGMDPPEPMVRTLAALEELPRGKTLLQINERVPQFLLPRLEELGFAYQVREQSDALTRVFIRRREESWPASHAAPMLGALKPIQEGAKTMSETTREPMQLDVRVIPPREKHPTIFHTFDALQPGESFILVNDHDPFPLRYQFEAERTGRFGWEYLERGREVWRVEISSL